MSTPNNPPRDDISQDGSSRALTPIDPGRLYVANLGNGQPESQPSHQTFSVALVLNALRQWWKVALPLGLLLGAAAGTLVYVFFRPTYEASAWLRIEDVRPYIAFQSREDSRRFVATQVELIRSPLVMGPVVSQPEVSGLAAAEKEEDPIQWLARGVKVNSVGQSELFKISFASRDRRGSATVVNAVVDAYFTLQRKSEAEETQRTIELLEEESQRRADDVTRLRDSVRTLSEKASLKDPLAGKTESGLVVGHPLGNLQARLANAEVEQAILAAQAMALQESIFGLGNRATTAADGSATVVLDGEKNDFTIVPAEAGSAFDGVGVVLEHKAASGDQALVRFDPNAKALVIDVDPQATTAATVVAEISKEGTFQAELVPEKGVASDGVGLVCQIEADIADATLDRSVEEHPEVQSLKGVIAAKQARLREWKVKLVKGEDDPLYRRLDSEAKEDEQRLDQVRNELRVQLKAEMGPALARNRLHELAEMQKQLGSKALLVDLLSKRCRSESENVSESSGDSVEVEFMRTELARAEEVFNLIESRIVKLRTEQRAPARVTRLQDAQPPTRPVEVLPYKQIGLASLAGLFFPFVLAVGWERIVGRVSGPIQLQRDAQLPVVGEVARIPAGRNVFSDSAPRRLKDAFGLFEESIDSLRTGLVLSEEFRDMKVLAVTSAANHEGKTSVAVQLAVSIARASGQQVLLVDGDLRSPDIHRLLKIPLAPGLAEVLSRRCRVDDAIATDWGQGVHLLPAGKLRGSPHRLVGNGELKAFLEEVAPRYRYIIIDTPPVLACSEALVFSRAADANLICTMRDASRLDQVKRTRDRLLAAGARTVGVVLNGVPAAQYAYRYGNYYGYKRRQSPANRGVEDGGGPRQE